MIAGQQIARSSRVSLDNLQTLIIFKYNNRRKLRSGFYRFCDVEKVGIAYIKNKVGEMVDARKVANKIEDASEKAFAYESKIFPYLDDIRYHIDKLELIVDNEMWPLPKYRELLFCR